MGEGKIRKKTLRLLSGLLRVVAVLGIAYLLAGLGYGGVALYCYNVRNWELCGGFSVPPLFFPFGAVFTLTFWPVYLWADWINGVGVFSGCL